MWVAISWLVRGPSAALVLVAVVGRDASRCCRAVKLERKPRGKLGKTQLALQAVQRTIPRCPHSSQDQCARFLRYLEALAARLQDLSRAARTPPRRTEVLERNDYCYDDGDEMMMMMMVMLHLCFTYASLMLHLCSNLDSTK